MKNYRIKFTGNFWEYFGLNIVWLILDIGTLGLFAIYHTYWLAKWFFTKMEIVEKL